MADISKNMWSLAPQPLKTIYIEYNNAYGHQTWQGGDFPYGTLTYKVK